MPSMPVWKSPFRANQLQEEYQYSTDVTGLSNGNFLITWSDENATAAAGTGSDIVAQMYDPFGVKIGGTLYLNEGWGEVRNENNASVAATQDGGFVIVYSYISGTDSDYLFRRFDADGMPAGQDRTIISDTSDGDYHYDVEIVARPDGSFVVTYKREGTTGEDNLYFKTISASGTLGAEVELRSDDFGEVYDPTAATLNDGRVAVAFREEDGVNNLGPEVTTIDGSSVDFNTNVTSAAGQTDVDVAALSNGGYVVSWREGNEVLAQLYNSDDSLKGSEFTLAHNTDNKDNAQIVGLKGGGFAMAFINRTDQKISVASYNNNGVLIFEKRNFNYQGFDAYNLDLSATVDDRLLLGWEVYTDDTYNDSDIFAAIVDPRKGAIEVAQEGITTVAKVTGGDIFGTNGNDTIQGMDGRDDIDGRNGRDEIYGGRGNDELSGGNQKDTVVGAQGADEIYGNKGDDIVKGGNSNDSVYGGDGDDEVTGGKGNDRMYGGKGDDTLYGLEDNDRMYGGNGIDTLYGDSGKDTLYGGDGLDKLYGGDGADDLYGGKSNGGGSPVRDLLLGGKGNDNIYGGNGIDWIRGNEGRDDIYGGAGADLLLGDSNAGERPNVVDHFIYKAASDSGPGGNKRDVILDFNANTDVIDLSAIDADTTRGGNQAFEWIGGAGFSDAGQLRATVQNGDIYLLADRNGDGNKDFEIKLEAPGEAIDGGDFIL